jgi:hypothetical protein
LSLILSEEHRPRVFENSIWTEEGWSDRRVLKLLNEELHDLYFSPSIIGMIKPRGPKWTRNVARMRSKRKAYMLLVGKPKVKRPLERQDVGGCIMMQWILERYSGVVWAGLVWLRIRTNGRLL